MMLLTAAFLLGLMQLIKSETCPYPCTKQVRVFTACGLYGWSRCMKYTVRVDTCYKECELTTKGEGVNGEVVNGGWSEFKLASTSECSVSCGGGDQTLTYKRQCDKPAPQNGGAYCVGDDNYTEIQACHTHPCPGATHTPTQHPTPSP